MAFDPNREQVELAISDEGLTLKEWTEYHFDSNFLEPSDRWTFTVAAETLPDKIRKALNPGNLVKLFIDGHVQSTGYISELEIEAAKGGNGTAYRISGRDKLAQAINANADPTKAFTQGQSLEDVLKSLFAPYGWGDSRHFVASNVAARDVKTGKFTGEKLTHGGKKHGPREVKDWKIHQLQPRPGEGVFQFATRVSQRFGLWIWLSPDGQQLIVAEPDFEQKPSHVLYRGTQYRTNIISGSVRHSVEKQPSVIVAEGFSGGGQFASSPIKAVMVNTAVKVKGTSSLPDEVQPYLKAGAVLIQGPTIKNPIEIPKHVVYYQHDDESQTQEQLNFFIRRQMALHQRESLTVNYTVDGHGQLDKDGAFVPWAVDTVVSVQDEIAGVSEDLYVLGRSFTKSRGGSGTQTRLELIRLNTLIFGDDK